MTPRRKRPAKADPPPAEEPQLQISYDQPPALEVFPHQLRPGDVYRDEAGVDWTVAAPPPTYREGKRVGVTLAMVPMPSVRSERDWAAHEKVTVRRPVG